MRKWLGALLSGFLLLSGCGFDKESRPVHDEKESAKVGKGLNEQLFAAAEHGNVDEISRLIEKGANINAQDSNGKTPVMIATYNNDVAAAKILIDARADVDIRDNMKNNVFLYAGAEGYIDILKLAINAGADPHITNRYGGVAVIPAAERGHVDVVELLLTETDINVNHVNNLGWTALIEAIILNKGGKRQQVIIRLLIDHGADVNIPDGDGVTPLEHARNKGFREIEKTLIEAGAK
ncbi:ankyrin repeat domain-containing protein [Bacillus sp. FJAT-27445]|uniref:ankyrin repeat domain-containing protein n=1 Tax=Bacillus sp. FJAT-27445 TaxID=1679166 RepID=UPI000AA7D5C4|nr:ankyrin repeat domain-containing protein [Bacillus sp. FJAT-27445]